MGVGVVTRVSCEVTRVSTCVGDRLTSLAMINSFWLGQGFFDRVCEIVIFYDPNICCQNYRIVRNIDSTHRRRVGEQSGRPPNSYWTCY